MKWLNDANVFKFKSQMREKVASHVSPHVSAEVQIVGALTIISNLPRLLRLRLRELRHISTSFKSDKSVFWGSETFSSTSIWWSMRPAKWFPNFLYRDPITCCFPCKMSRPRTRIRYCERRKQVLFYIGIIFIINNSKYSCLDILINANIQSL